MHLGVAPFECVNILGFNSVGKILYFSDLFVESLVLLFFFQPEWLIANTGSIVASCIAAGIYSTNTADACAYITEHSRAAVVVLEDNKQLAKYASLQGQHALPHLKAIVMWIGTPDEKLISKLSVPVYTWDQFLSVGGDVVDADVEARMNIAVPGNCSTLIYTSGTTGPPKAVMISHDNVTWTIADVVENYFQADHNDKIVSFLPLSHIAAQLIDIHFPMLVGGCTCTSANQMH